jgi:hypothetical protein
VAELSNAALPRSIVLLEILATGSVQVNTRSILLLLDLWGLTQINGDDFRWV